MGYQLLEFRCGTDHAQGYVLQGTGPHEGTNESVSVGDMMANATEGSALARFLDYRFLRAHGERVARDMGFAQVDEHRNGEDA